MDAIAPNTIIRVFTYANDTPENIDLKKLYFPKFYQAYKQKDIYSGDVWNFLHTLYRQVRYEEYNNFEHSEGEQIEMMIDALQLERKPSD